VRRRTVSHGEKEQKGREGSGGTCVNVSCLLRFLKIEWLRAVLDLRGRGGGGREGGREEGGTRVAAMRG
jgi:hypothetical protein